ncbi:MAG: serine/threonine-protein phosphatase, partial [Solirubrobacterales bacterium]|nr:serine/threonine-protein phosphatase [Solirubrobacterales bacterium]
TAEARTPDPAAADRVAVRGTPHGRALAEQAVVVVEDDPAGARVYAPVTNRGEAIGVLELVLPAAPDADAIADVALAAHALAYVVIANRRFTDLFEWGKRSVPLSLAAEIQHRLLPGSYTCEAGQFTLAAWLEPAGDVGGDTFDFTMSRDTLHLSMTDAMGHTVNAALLATLLVGGLRNARRAGTELGEQARRANADLNANAPRGSFVTGQVVRVDLERCTAEIVNAGHPPPLRLRDGQVAPVALRADPPFGTMGDWQYRVQELELRRGDRLVFFTDGVFERQAGRLDVEALVLEAADLHPRQAVQHLIDAILETTGEELEDDATVMCFDWHGGPPRDRDSDSGADVQP